MIAHNGSVLLLARGVPHPQRNFLLAHHHHLLVELNSEGWGNGAFGCVSEEETMKEVGLSDAALADYAQFYSFDEARHLENDNYNIAGWDLFGNGSDWPIWRK